MNKKVLAISGSLFLLIAILFWYFNNQHVITIKNKEIEDKIIIKKETFNNTPTKIILGYFTQPQYNNTKEIILLTDDKGHNLYLKSEKDTEAQLLLSKKGMSNNFGWSKDSQNVYFKEKNDAYKTIVKSININTKKITTHLNLSPLTELKSIATSDTTYYLDKKTLAVKAHYNNTEWNITSKKGNYYSILVSPNNQYLVVHNGANILLFKTTGEFIKILGQGIASCWSANNQELIGFLDSSNDGIQISNSELYLFSINGTTKQITHTENHIEMWPTFKSDSEVIYYDAKQNGIFSISL